MEGSEGPSWRERWVGPGREFDFRDVSSLGKWVAIASLIGLCAGLASLLFDVMIRFAQSFLLEGLMGYHVTTVGHVSNFTFTRWWLLPLVLAATGFLGGLVIWRWAPEASGIGTDAVVKAFHQGRPVKLRVAALKMVTSSITVGAGGTSGVEGPIAQIGAGLGSTVGRLLHLDARDRTIALCAGLGAGIAAAFKAPLAGALIAVEVFYREDFEVEAILPALFASVVGYSVVGFTVGWDPLYHTTLDPYSFGNPITLALYAVLGVLCAAMTRVAFRIFFPIQALSRRLWLPLSTTLGAAATGLVALVCLIVLGAPTVLGTGHEWLQNLILGQGLHGAATPMLLLLAAAILEIASNAFTIGMGNAGGIFGPSLVAGGFLGGAFGLEASHLWPTLVPNPAPFVIVGMIAYFAGTVKAPLGTIVMVAEITGGYGLLAPAMLAVVISYLLSGKHSLFPSQVRSRLDSPSKAHDFEPLVLRRVRVGDVVKAPAIVLTKTTPLEEANQLLSKTGQSVLAVVEADSIVGLVTRRDIDRVPASERVGRCVVDVMATDLIRVRPDDDLFSALSALLESDAATLSVVQAGDGARFQGLLDRRDIHGVLVAARRSVTGP